jgi:selenide,water dikinase
MGPGALAQVLRLATLDQYSHPDLLVGLQTSDDAAVIRLSPELALVQTVDFFPPIVDDPWTYGAIAAANSMSDVFAMGGEVLVALNIAAFPDDLPYELLAEIFAGGAAKVAEAGGIVAGGHTVADPEPKYGLSVTGTVHPARILTKAAARPGDRVFLTKPIGTGAITTALKNGAAPAGAIEAAVGAMSALNLAASRAARRVGVNACTDVTGFGLLGHAAEVASKSVVALRLSAGAVPLLTGAREAAAAGHLPGGLTRNREHFALGEEATVAISSDVDPVLTELLFDPVTSGPLLITAPSERARALQDEFASADLPLWEIGEATDGRGIEVLP